MGGLLDDTNAGICDFVVGLLGLCVNPSGEILVEGDRETWRFYKLLLSF